LALLASPLPVEDALGNAAAAAAAAAEADWAADCYDTRRHRRGAFLARAR